MSSADSCTRPPPGRDLLLRLAFPGRPLRGEEPGLVSRDGHVAAHSDRPVVMNRKLNLVAFTDVQRPPDLLGQCQLRFGSHLHPGADAGRRFDLGGRHPHGTSSPSSRIFRRSSSISQAGLRHEPLKARSGRSHGQRVGPRPGTTRYSRLRNPASTGAERYISNLACRLWASDTTSRGAIGVPTAGVPITEYAQRRSRLGPLTYWATALRSSSSGGGVKIPWLAPVK